MYFRAKNTLKSNHYNNAKHAYLWMTLISPAECWIHMTKCFPNSMRVDYIVKEPSQPNSLSY
jgi:hypothetical protein